MSQGGIPAENYDLFLIGNYLINLSPTHDENSFFIIIIVFYEPPEGSFKL